MPAPGVGVLTLLVTVRGADKRTLTIKVMGRNPDGETKNLTTTAIEVTAPPPEALGAGNLVAQLGLALKGEGIYWFDVYIDEVFKTSVPLLVKFEQVTAEPASQ